MRDKEQIAKLYERWVKRASGDADVAAELKAMEQDRTLMEDAFYRDLAFGTGGLRGVIGAGTNRMNIYTVAKASQGLADYVKKQAAPLTSGGRKEAGNASIAVSYDSRIKSRLFAEVSAGVFAANGIQVFMYSELMPTPCLSFAVRELKCAAGIMVTASHNPSKYNGYKVYGPDGCQITTKAAEEILSEIEKLDIFEDVNAGTFAEGLASGAIQYIPEEIYTNFVNAVKSQSLLGNDTAVDKNAAIVYSPLNGTGLKPVLRTLRESGYGNITVVPEQEQPDGRFPTCPYPNPEIREAMELGIKCAEENRAELLLATDPDCDRVGIAVRAEDGSYPLLSGNETGMLLLDYICARRTALGTMPKDPVMVKTIVTIDMAERIAAHYGVRTVNVLTGFKFIGEQIGLLEKQGREDSYIFGFEESYGYLSGSYVRDKDAVDGAFLICEMFAYYKAQGKSLLTRLEELYQEYGFCLNTLHSYAFEGASGFEKMNRLMERFRAGIESFGGRKTESCLDYSKGIDGLPKSDVLKFILHGNASVVIRPSGTEPKMKAYISVSAENREAAQKEEARIADQMERLFEA